MSKRQYNQPETESEKFIIVVLGREWRDGSDRYHSAPPHCRFIRLHNTVIISTPDASKFNQNEKHILDLMALSHLGPHVYLLEEDSGEQLQKWQGILGDDISPNIIYITHNHSDRFPCKCINKETTQTNMTRCEHIYEKDIRAKHSFGEMLKRRISQLQGNPSPGVQQGSPPLKLVLLGECGSGKSASGNTILGQTAFKSVASSMPTTTECTIHFKSVHGTEMQVIDTPDLFNDEIPQQSKNYCNHVFEGGLCVYLLVIQIGRFTEDEREILEKLEDALQTRVRDRAIILFTHGDDLKHQPLDDYVRKTNISLQQLISKCGNRYHVFNNNKREAQQQVKELMRKVAKLVWETDKIKVFPEYDPGKNNGMERDLKNCVIT